MRFCVFSTVLEDEPHHWALFTCCAENKKLFYLAVGCACTQQQQIRVKLIKRNKYNKTRVDIGLNFNFNFKKKEFERRRIYWFFFFLNNCAPMTKLTTLTWPWESRLLTIDYWTGVVRDYVWSVGCSRAQDSRVYAIGMSIAFKGFLNSLTHYTHTHTHTDEV